MPPPPPSLQWKSLWGLGPSHPPSPFPLLRSSISQAMEKMTARSTPVTKRSVILKCHPARSSHRGGVLNLGKRLYGVAWTDLSCKSSIGKGVKILFVPTLLHPLFMQVLVVAAFTLHWVNTFFSMRRSQLMPNNAII